MTDDLDKNESDSAESEDKKEDPIDDLRQFAMDQSNTNDDEITLKFDVSEMSGEEEDKDQGESSPETNPANEQSIEDKPDRGFHAGTDDTQAMAADIKDAFGISDSPNLEDTSVMAGVSSSAEDDPDVTQTIPLSSEAETVVEKIQDTKPKNVPTPMPDEAETKPPIDTSKPKVPAPRSLGESSTNPPPAIDSEGMPLPRSATRPNIVTGPSRTSQTRTQPITDRKPQNPLKRKDTSKPPRKKRRRGGGCFIRIAIILSFVLLILSIGAGSYMLLQYYSIAATLPDVEELQNRVSDFETTNILDRNGELLYEILDPNAGRRTFVSLDEISPFLIAATIATEDKDYYSHPGFDFWAIVRAFWQNISSGETVSGASTITQQLARTLLLDPDEAFQRTYTRKVKEALLAIEITRKYSKEEILELYLNEIYFGNLAYGIEAAAQTYFGISADKLTLAQGSFLAGLPQAPSVYDVYRKSVV